MVQAVAGPELLIYLLLNKPKGFVTTVTDPERRPTVANFGNVQGQVRLLQGGNLLLLKMNDRRLTMKTTQLLNSR